MRFLQLLFIVIVEKGCTEERSRIGKWCQVDSNLHHPHEHRSSIATCTQTVVRLMAQFSCKPSINPIDLNLNERGNVDLKYSDQLEKKRACKCLNPSDFSIWFKNTLSRFFLDMWSRLKRQVIAYLWDTLSQQLSFFATPWHWLAGWGFRATYKYLTTGWPIRIKYFKPYDSDNLMIASDTQICWFISHNIDSKT